MRIDAYHENTQDQAHFHGHYYSEKAPGLVFLALPFAIAAQAGMRALKIDPESVPAEYALSYIVGACAVALPTALAAVCVFFLALRFGASTFAAVFAALLMSLGTPMWAYASLFWAHALVGACLVFAFAAALKLRDDDRAEFSCALAVGIAAGWATVTEYPAAPASAMLALLAFAQVWPRGRLARWRVIAGVSLGEGICVIVLLSYLHAAFGSFRPSYAYYDPNSFSFMQQQGFFGLTYPHPDRLMKLLFGCARGLFFASPVMIAAPAGLWWLWRERAHRTGAVAIGGIVAYYFLFNASFYWWKAGLTFGPRYAGACIPLFSIGIAIAWQRATPIWRWILAVLAVCSICVALMVVSTTSQLAMQDSCPFVHSTWPAFWSGKIATNRDSMLTVAEAGSTGRYGAFNLGQLLGLHGLESLIPLLLIWGIAGGLLWRFTRASHVSVLSHSR